MLEIAAICLVITALLAYLNYRFIGLRMAIGTMAASLTLSLARAFAPEIRVNAVCPGYVATPWFSGRFGEENSKRIADQQADANPLKRVAYAEDIANAVLFLASPMANWITGTALVVDGGGLA